MFVPGIVQLGLLAYVTVTNLRVEELMSRNLIGNPAFSVNASLFASLALGASAVASFAFGLWHPLVQSVQFCANGVAWAVFRFAPWSTVRLWHWDDAASQLTLSLNNTVVTLNIPRDDWPKIRDVLCEHVAV